MQLLGKQYFGNEEGDHALPMQEGPDAPDMTEDGGLEELVEAIDGKRRMPAWMSAAAGIMRDNRRHVIAAASVLVIGFAVYLNWTMSGGSGEMTVDDMAAGQVLSEEDAAGMADGLTVDGVSADGVPEDDYFAVSQINRQRARDEAIAVLQDVVEGAVNLSDVQSDALSQISQIAADIENEAAIESLVRGKGFADCVAVISGDNANVIVRTEALLPNEVAQIQEIVYETAGILPANVKIIEK